MRTSTGGTLALMLGLALAGCQYAHIAWNVDQLGQIGKHAPEVLGSPKVVADGAREAVCFDGVADGLFIPVNPIEGWKQFTVEVLFKPASDGKEEQRFLHIEDGEGRRLLIETRVNPDRTWSLDTFLRKDDKDKLTQLDRARTQPTDQWYWAALTYDGATMRQYLNGELQLEGAVNFTAMKPGRTSLGVRQNKVHWFKGCIAEVRFYPGALGPATLARP